MFPESLCAIVNSNKYHIMKRKDSRTSTLRIHSQNFLAGMEKSAATTMWAAVEGLGTRSLYDDHQSVFSLTFVCLPGAYVRGTSTLTPVVVGRSVCVSGTFGRRSS